MYNALHSVFERIVHRVREENGKGISSAEVVLVEVGSSLDLAVNLLEGMGYTVLTCNSEVKEFKNVFIGWGN